MRDFIDIMNVITESESPHEEVEAQSSTDNEISIDDICGDVNEIIFKLNSYDYQNDSDDYNNGFETAITMATEMLENFLKRYDDNG